MISSAALSLAGDLSEREAIVARVTEDLVEPLSVGQFALVEREHALIEVAVEVERTNADVSPVQATLQEAPEVLHDVRDLILG